MVLASRPGEVAPQLDRLLRLTERTWDYQQRVEILGVRASGDDVVLRFLASSATMFVRVHVQHTGTGGGGEAYNRNTFVSDTRVDCRANRQQDVTIVRDAGGDYTIWLIPEFLTGTTYIRFDGSTGEGADQMAFLAVGPNSQKVNELIIKMENLNEKLDRMLTHLAEVSGLDLKPGER